MLISLMAIIAVIVLLSQGVSNLNWQFKLALFVAFAGILIPRFLVLELSLYGALLGVSVGIIVGSPVLFSLEKVLSIVEVSEKARGQGIFGDLVSSDLSDPIWGAIRWCTLGLFIEQGMLVRVPVALNKFIIEVKQQDNLLEGVIKILEATAVTLIEWVPSVIYPALIIISPLVVLDLLLIVINKITPNVFSQSDIFVLRTFVVYGVFFLLVRSNLSSNYLTVLPVFAPTQNGNLGGVLDG